MESTNQGKAPKTRWLKIAVPGALVAGLAVGALFSPVGIAAAQDGEEAEQSSESSEKTDEEREAKHAERKAERAERKAERRASVAEAIGVSEEDLAAGFEAGQTLAEIAEANDVDREALVAALVANAEERIDAAVAEGKIDEAKATEKRENLEERIEEKIDRTPGERSKGMKRSKSKQQDRTEA